MNEYELFVYESSIERLNRRSVREAAQKMERQARRTRRGNKAVKEVNRPSVLERRAQEQADADDFWDEVWHEWNSRIAEREVPTEAESSRPNERRKEN